ncbi:MAG TPA: hypothetical protein VN397_02655, partial [Candidatus Methylomirabilis sp.]|nr:hypothetical protein [Candidatus Methylomirabilis sp.]
MTMPLPTPDLATDPDLRWRAGKIIAEKLARKLGVELAETGPFQAIGRELKGFLGTGTAAHWLTSAGGIFAATGLQSPRVLANSLAGFTGFDADKLHDLLNEAFDSTILSTVSAMERAGRSQAEIEAKVDEHLKRLKDDDKFDFKDEIRVVVFGGGIHDRECTTVLDRERTQRRRRNNQDDDDDDDRPRLRPDAREMTLAKAIDLGYS